MFVNLVPVTRRLVYDALQSLSWRRRSTRHADVNNADGRKKNVVAADVLARRLVLDPFRAVL